jgi:hypothetical protein
MGLVVPRAGLHYRLADHAHPTLWFFAMMSMSGSKTLVGPRRLILSAWPALILFTVLAWLLTGCPGREPSTLDSARREVRAPSPQTDAEPSVPEMIEWEADAQAPNRVHVRLMPKMEGRARLVFENDPVRWLTPRPAGLLTLSKGQAPVQMTFERPGAKALAAMKDKTLRIGLELLNERGETVLHYRREIPLSADAATTGPQTPRAVPQMGVSATGKPVQARVPASAPAPRLLPEAAP